MNKRILKIDSEHAHPWNDDPSCRVQFYGHDADGDQIRIELTGDDAREFLRLAQAVAGQERFMTDHLIEQLNEQRTLIGDIA